MNEFEYAKMEAAAGHTHESSSVQRTYFKRHGLGTQVRAPAHSLTPSLPHSLPVPTRSLTHA